MKNLILTVLASFILASCSGSGLKTYGEYLSASKNSENSNVVIYRSSAFVGGGAFITVTLNGSELGRLGNNEFVIGEMQDGRNYLNLKVGGIQGLGINQTTKIFEKKTKSNTYFYVNFTYDSMNTFGPVNLKIAINEISLYQFRAAVAKNKIENNYYF